MAGSRRTAYCVLQQRWGSLQRCSVLCVATETRHFGTARLERGLVGAHNERPHWDSKVPAYSVQARFGVMRSVLAEVARADGGIAGGCDGYTVQVCERALHQGEQCVRAKGGRAFGSVAEGGEGGACCSVLQEKDAAVSPAQLVQGACSVSTCSIALKHLTVLWCTPRRYMIQSGTLLSDSSSLSPSL